MKTRRKREKGWYKPYILFELLALVVMVLIAAVLYVGVRRQVVETNEASAFRLSEMCYDNNVALASREALQFIRTLTMSKGYSGNVASQLVSGVDDPDFWIDGDILILYYTDPNGDLRFWDLYDFFSKDELEPLFDNDKGFENNCRISRICAAEGEDGDYTLTALDYGTFEVCTIGDDSKGEEVYEDLHKDIKVIDDVRLVAFKQCDMDLEADENVYTNTVTYQGSIFQPNSKYYKIRTDDPTMFFTLGFDVDRIAFELSLKQMLLSAAVVQTLAFYFMILYDYSMEKRARERKNRDNFIDAVAHELKTPVAVVSNTAEYLATGKRPEKQAHYLEVLTHESSYMNDLLNRMLTYSRVTDKTNKLDLTEVKLDDLADEILRSYEDKIAETGIKVERVQKGTTVLCDRALMRMVMDNLISNAIRYGQKDKIIKIVTDGKKFSVWNKSEPFDEEILKKLWTSMDVVALKDQGSHGSGMGLSISAGILERHKASYEVKNEDGGIRFGFDMEGVKRSENGTGLVAIYAFIAIVDILLTVYWSAKFLEQDGYISFIAVCSWLMLSALYLENLVLVLLKKEQ